ncbi:6682_t:CDS:2 [Ambispora gerdemannii]|uniref:6682_t:CDS:1 n=1 Tax=Ambispora gerdemannii TaxID=144530 RepID=A0A9N9FCV9_9GLOM|nr:6682_t:CDS:2 [Ambispora gerdemannii]
MPRANKYPKVAFKLRYFSIPRAKRAGAIDCIEDWKTKDNLISLIQHNNNVVQLTDIPSLYLGKYNKALEYTGKLRNVITNEFPDCMQVMQMSGKTSIVKLAERLHVQTNNTKLDDQSIITLDLDTEDDETSDMEINEEENMGVGEAIMADNDTEEFRDDEKQTAILKMANLSSLQFDILKAIFIANPQHRDWRFLLDE